MMKRLSFLGVWLGACAGPTLGHGGHGLTYADLDTRVRAGFDDKKSVVALLGAPQRTVRDAAGRDVYFYYWADGRGGGEHALVAFNSNGVVFLVDVAR